MASEWLERFRQGSFRGVEFKTDSHERSGGRRKVNHEFPQRDQGRSEDLGKITPSFSLDLLVIGDDYFDQRDALLDALEEVGPGVLVHPYLGTISVQVGTFSMRETVTEGRMARFSVEFSEAGEILFPDSSADTLQNALAFADSTIDEAKGFFETVFDTVNAAANVIDSASESIRDGMDFLEDAVKQFTDPISNLSNAISNLKADSAALARLPGELADRIADVFNTLIEEFTDDPRTARLVLGTFVGFGVDEVIGTTVGANRTNVNGNALQNIYKQIAVSNESKAVVETQFISTNEAVEVRDSIAFNLDDLLDNEPLQQVDENVFVAKPVGDDLYQAMKDLQSIVVKALPPGDLADVKEVTFKRSLPVLVIAYELFQDVEKEQEIIDQNGIRHPGFAPENDPIEVIGGV